MRHIIIAAALSACATTSAPQPAPSVTGPHTVRWSRVGANVDGQRESAIECTETISHPCPFLTYTRRLTIGDAITWDDATGGTDLAGVTAERRAPWVDELELDGGAIVLESRGDDGGLRLPARLEPTADGWSGDVAWNLFTEAGETTFHVEVTR